MSCHYIRVIVCNTLIDFVLSIIEADNFVQLVMFVIERIIDIINYRLFLFHFFFVFHIQLSFSCKILKDSLCGQYYENLDVYIFVSRIEL